MSFFSINLYHHHHNYLLSLPLFLLLLFQVITTCFFLFSISSPSSSNVEAGYLRQKVITFPGQLDRTRRTLPSMDGWRLKARHYSGYLSSLNETQLFYWFFESQRDPANDPLILWLSGGPGCSSLFGAIGEVAPLRMQPNGSITDHQRYAWNRRANLLFVESPAGVGFSYRPGVTKYETDDNETVAINYAALCSFYTKFPHLLKNTLYLTGESYAARYIADLATEIQATGYPASFGGLAIGNGKFDNDLENKAFRPFLKKYHNLTAYSYEQKGNLTRPLWVYNLKKDCQTTTPFSYQYLYIPETRTKSEILADEAEKPLCGSEEAIRQYFSRPEVLEALHVDTEQNPEEWRICAFIKPNFFNYTAGEENQLPVIRNLVRSKAKVLLYWGDADAVTNYFAAYLFVRKLKFKVNGTEELTRTDGSIYGSAESFKEFSNLLFVRMIDAGHMVPVDEPEGALKLITERLLDQQGSDRK